jgi:hypothetical protein
MKVAGEGSKALYAQESAQRKQEWRDRIAQRARENARPENGFGGLYPVKELPAERPNPQQMEETQASLFDAFDTRTLKQAQDLLMPTAQV